MNFTGQSKMFKLSFVQKAIFIISSPAPLRSVHTRQHIAATNCFVYWRNFVKTFVSATEFCCSNMLQKIKSGTICASCCGDKILLQRQRFTQEFSSTHEAICPLRCVAATSRLSCRHSDLSP